MYTPNLLIKRLQILMMARLFIATFFLFYAQFVFPSERIVFYSLIAFIAIVSLIYIFWLVVGMHLRALAFIQIGLDLGLETVLIYFTGGLESLFATVYVLSILSAGFVLSPNSSFYIAANSSLLFIGCVCMFAMNLGPRSLSQELTIFPVRLDWMYVFYATYVRVTVFFVVAFLSYYFSGMIRRLENQMKMQERLALLGEVVSTIAHEIRNPLASISGSVELFNKEMHQSMSSKQLKRMNAVVDESERIKRIFNELLDYVRVPSLTCECIPAKKYLNEILSLISHQDFYDSRVKITRAYYQKKMNLFIDPEYMKQALMNVLANAFQAMPQGGCIKIDCQDERGVVRLSIHDSGVGMNKKSLNSLFIPFKTSKAGGTGLGMAQTYKIVNQHGGKITVKSKKGEGTLVDLTLPKCA
jgi:two-component system, NtrC family, sensor histidine kinase HydH